MIFVLKDGQLIERGRYDDLIRHGGVFAKLAAQGKFVSDAHPEPELEAQPEPEAQGAIAPLAIAVSSRPSPAPWAAANLS
jgi:hypothetical protein